MTAAILLLALGLCLIAAEVLFPSFGVLSVLATAALVGSIVLAFQESTTSGIYFLVATGALAPTVVGLAFKLLPRTPWGKRMVIGGLSFGSVPSLDQRDLELLGKEGTVEADCRPAGMARLDGRRVDVVARGEWLERGERVKVVEVKGNRVVVAKLSDGT